MASLYKAYNRLLQAHPWKTQMIQTGFLMGLGDFAAQKLVDKKPLKDIDGSRVVRFAAIGAFYAAPILRAWYGVLDRTFGAAGRTVALKKMLSDQLGFAPIFLASMLSMIELSRNGFDLKETWKFLRSTYTDVLITNYFIWPPIQLVNFYAVPLEYRILVVQLVALFFNTYLAWRTNLPSSETTLMKHRIGK